MTAEWLEIRCRSRTCTTPGGRILYHEKLGGLISVRFGKRGHADRRTSAVVLIGVPVVLVCACGWVWRNDALATVMNLTDAACEAG